MDLPIQTILAAALPVFCLLFLGFVLRRIRILTTEADSSLMKLVVSILYPCLFLEFVIGNPALEGGKNLLSAPLVGFFTTSLGFLAGYLLARSIGLVPGRGLRTFAFCNGIYNYGFIPIPVIIALFGARETLGVLLVHNVGVEIAIWTCGIILLSGQFKVSALKRLANPPIIALLVALFVNAVGADTYIPGWLSSLISMLSACTIPLGILLAGASIADLFKDSLFKGGPKIPVASVGLRLALLPMGFILAAAFLPGISTELRQVIIVEAAMPAGIFPIVLSRHYGGDPSVAVKVVLSTTLFSVITMPFWIRFGTSFVF